MYVSDCRVDLSAKKSYHIILVDVTRVRIYAIAIISQGSVGCSTIVTLKSLGDGRSRINTQLYFTGKSAKPPPRVAFFVGLRENVGPFKDNLDLVYDKLVTNIGDGYDKTTGRFTAPKNGTYQFTVVVAAQGQKKVRLMTNTLIHTSILVLELFIYSVMWITKCD